MEIQISAIICAYNPREDYFSKVLKSLKNQTVPKANWEIIVIDNNSTQPLSSIYNIDWHPNGKFVIEKNTGLAHARKRGFLEAKGKLIVCVDDDIILDKDYLKNSWDIYNSHPFLGVFGCQIQPEFEEEPKLKIEYYGNAQRIIEKDLWSNSINEYYSTPFGAGMCIRKEVIDKYLLLLEQDDFRLKLGRKGDQLLSCEDIDLVFAACEMGFGKGMFKRLIIKHFVPTKKMQVGYLISNIYWNTFSAVIQNYYLFQAKEKSLSIKEKLMFLLRLINVDSFTRKSKLAKLRAEKAAFNALKRGEY